MTKYFIFLLLPILTFAQPRLDRQGHRGCRGLMPENTVAAMKKALDLGVTTLELDIVISKDKQVVVSHDTYMVSDIATKPDGSPVTKSEEKSLNLYQMTYDEIKRYDVGRKPHPLFPQQQKQAAYKPLLGELIDSVEVYARAKRMPQPRYNIEIKCSPQTDGTYHPAPAEFVKLAMDVINSRKLGNRFNIQSFDVRPLQLLHEQHPNVVLAHLTANPKTLAENLQTLGFKPAIYSPYYKTVTAELVKACHEQGLKIIPWTVNTKPEIDALTGLGVDGIITDYPNLF
ncbi:glycerophosphodiester phosphodiesterase family protein [Spirosoma sordidisoli]|uniref:Glycerophosphodiester phosphodiesterase n=1 Tax=Spirosoma sordidisoli TaxID=2502893 RepID=A0A4V1RVD7_9BACT|nr:glycerophosphodiester phosphodiesterase family protein [Spirosoma sordidisoli]RYC66408.1 glycerophosphodiester phosphodiesterase [Spirosoma sordidisoli]